MPYDTSMVRLAQTAKTTRAYPSCMKIPGRPPHEFYATLIEELKQGRTATITASDPRIFFVAWNELGMGFSPLCEDCVAESIVKRRVKHSLVEYELDEAFVKEEQIVGGIVHATALIEELNGTSILYIRSIYRSLNSGKLYYSNGSYELNLFKALMQRSKGINRSMQ